MNQPPDVGKLTPKTIGEQSTYLSSFTTAHTYAIHPFCSHDHHQMNCHALESLTFNHHLPPLLVNKRLSTCVGGEVNGVALPLPPPLLAVRSPLPINEFEMRNRRNSRRRRTTLTNRNYQFAEGEIQFPPPLSSPLEIAGKFVTQD